MPFTLFDPNCLNITARMHLTAFSSKSFDILKTANKEYEKIPKIFLDTKKHSLREYKKYFRKSVLDNNPHQFRENIVDLKKDYSILTSQKWYSDQQRQLNNPKYWKDITDQFKNDLGHQKKILTLKKLWVKNANFSLYTSQALAQTLKVLPVFENYYEFADLELKFNQSKIPIELYKKLKSYLDQLLVEITSEKNQLCEAMLARLEVSANKRELKFDDVIFSVLENIGNGGQKTLLNARPRNGLNPKLYKIFVTNILKLNNPQQVRRLQKLFWCKEDNWFYTKISKGNIFIIPRQINPALVTSFPIFWIGKIFKGRNLRSGFFQEHFQLLLNLRYVYQITHIPLMDLNTLLECELWQKLSEINNNLENTYTTSNAFRKQFMNRIFRRETCSFLKEWQSFVVQSQKRMLLLKIKYADTLAQQIKTRAVFAIEEKSMSSEKLKKMVRAITSEIDDSLTTLILEKEELEFWKKTKTIFASVMSEKNNKFPCNRITALERNIQGPELILDHEDTLVEKFEQIEKKYIQKNQLVIDRSILDCLNQLEILLPSFKCYSVNYSIFWRKLFIAFINTRLSVSYDETLEKIIQFMFNNAPKYLREKLRSLEEYRMEDNSFLFETKCRALVFSLQDEDDSKVNDQWVASIGVKL